MKVGLEIHQQLATGKLFCDCPTELSETVVARAVRRLRATSGENHTVDRAAAFQAAQDREFRYEAVPTSCLVELDEEPPHRLNASALDVALTLALLLDARPVDEIQVMRKIVVDGSNTSGFQRTALVAVDGRLDLGGKRYSIPTICLEEDAARKVGEGEGMVTYRLDRLGIPLVEIATGPEIVGGPEARAVAQELGSLLRATRKVRRGIGTIREDLNVSTEGGTRVEIKGVQELRLLERYAASEVARQSMLLAARATLKERGARVPSTKGMEVTALVAGKASGGFAKGLKDGGVALGIPLIGFAGLLRPSGDPPERLGRELADAARTTGVRGLVHSDELPGFGLDGGDIEALRKTLGAPGALDAFVLVSAPDRSAAQRALDRVAERAAAAIVGVPPETRDPLPDGRSRYSRPLPGRDRMYPETDVPPVPVTPDRLARLTAELPEPPAVARVRLAALYSLPPEQIQQLQGLDEVDQFESLVALGHPAGLVARLLIQELAESTPSGGETAPLPTELLAGLLDAVRNGRFSKEGIGPVLRALRAGAPDISEAASRAGFSDSARSDLDALARSVVEKNGALVKSRGGEAFAPLMGDLMKELRGKRDGREIADALRRAIAESAERTD